MADDPRLEAGARALCGFHGLNPDEPALNNGSLVPLWRNFVTQARVVIEAADAADHATPMMEQAGVAALNAGAADSGGLVHKIWSAMSALRGT